MNDRTILLTHILTNPADDTCRLVFSDLLRESDAPSDQARGRFLWAGVTASRFRNADLIEDPLYYTAHQEIEEVASAGHPVRWLAEYGIADGNWAWDCTHDRVTVRVGLDSATYTRGMLSGIEVTLAQWYKTAPSVLAKEPLECAFIRDVPGLRFSIAEQDSNWRLTASIKVAPRRISLMGWPIPTSYSPSPFLMETDGNWRGEEVFASRESLMEAIVESSMAFENDLREELGNRWPRSRSDSRR